MTQFVAADATHTAPNPTRLILHAGRLVHVNSGSVLSDQVIVIENDVIVSVGPARETKAMPDQTTIDLTHAIVLAGLIDAHTHLTLEAFSERSALSTSIPRRH